MDGLDQGTILLGLRSNKYPEIPCYGIVITASCDISNDKVAKLYFLIGVDAKRWFCTEYAYRQVLKTKIKNLFDPVEKMCRQFGLDARVIQGFTLEEVRTVIADSITQKSDRDKFEKLYQSYAAYCRLGMDDEARRLVVQKETKLVQTFLKEIEKGKMFHLFYLPKSAYLPNSSQTDDGLIVDLQEIGSISMRDAKQIVGPGIDNLLLVGESEAVRSQLRAQFWLEREDDFVWIEGKVASPWREHLMQRFALDFARIGLDGATEQDYEKLAKSI